MVLFSELSHIDPTSTLIIGLSGGPDSVFLLHHVYEYCKHKQFRIVAAHLDHQWRTDSHDDMIWCQQLCSSLSIPFHTAKASDYKNLIKKNGSQEDLARSMRKLFFKDIQQLYNNAYILLGHHKDDQIETFFIRLARGASLQGLSGMKMQAPDRIIRPILSVSKDDILDFLHQHGLDYRIDSTNDSSDFLRNRIRKNIIPALNLADNRLSAHIIKTMHHAAQVQDFIHQTTLSTLKRITDQTTHGISIPQFLPLHPIEQHHMLAYLLLEARIQCTLSTALFKELLKYIKHGTSHQHHFTRNGIITKQNQSFLIRQK